MVNPASTTGRPKQNFCRKWFQGLYRHIPMSWIFLVPLSLAPSLRSSKGQTHWPRTLPIGIGKWFCCLFWCKFGPPILPTCLYGGWNFVVFLLFWMKYFHSSKQKRYVKYKFSNHKLTFPKQDISSVMFLEIKRRFCF